jgi:phage gp16-like protein
MHTATRTEIQLIQIGRRELGLDDETYRELLRNLTGGKSSSKDLTPAERQRVLNHMKARGFEVRPRREGKTTAAAAALAAAPAPAWRHEPLMRKLRAMWYALAAAGAVERPDGVDACNAAIEAWAQRMMARWPVRPERLRFARGEQLGRLVEEMKRWCQRLGLNPDDDAPAFPADEGTPP